MILHKSASARASKIPYKPGWTLIVELSLLWFGDAATGCVPWGLWTVVWRLPLTGSNFAEATGCVLPLPHKILFTPICRSAAPFADATTIFSKAVPTLIIL